MVNANDIEQLRKSFQALSFPESAISWLLMMYEAIQVFDDYADGDKVDREELNSLIWNTLVAIPQNPFYLANSQALYPLIATSILKWQASDTIERKKKADAKSFIWRAGYYDLVLMVGTLCHGYGWGKDNAHIILNLYGEKLDDYLKEFNHA